MNDLHIAIVNQLNPAHVHPTFALVEALTRRGYRVTYVTSERYEAEIASLGAEVLLGPRLEFPFDQPSDLSAPVSKQYCSDAIDLATRTVPAVWPFYEEHVPDLILFDTSAFTGLVLAERLRVPAIRMTPGLIYERENLDHASFTAQFREFMMRFSNRVDAFYQQHGIDRAGEMFIGPEPAIYFYLQELRLTQPAHRHDDIYAARCAAERPGLQKWKGKCPAGKRAVLISASTVYDQGPDYYRACVEALRELRLHCVLAVGASVDVASFGALGEDCEIVQGIPQLALMPHVDVIICLGGMTTTMEALYHGLPLVMLTHGKHHAEIYADNVEAHGLGIHLKGPHPTAASIRMCVEKINNDARMSARVKRAQQRVTSGAGAEEVAIWIEQHLERSAAGCR